MVSDGHEMHLTNDTRERRVEHCRYCAYNVRVEDGATLHFVDQMKIPAAPSCARLKWPGAFPDTRTAAPMPSAAPSANAVWAAKVIRSNGWCGHITVEGEPPHEVGCILPAGHDDGTHDESGPSSGPAEPEPGDECWGYSGSRDAEWWTGSLATREEAIAEALAELEEDVVWIYKGWKPAAAHFFPDADDLCETAAERASDEVGDPAEEYPEVSDEAKTELNALLEAWAEKHIATPRFWIGDGGEPERIERAGQFTSAGEKP
jgi:hypothetical protein